MKLVNFLRDRLDGAWSAKSLKQAIERNACKVNGQIETFASYSLRTNDRVDFQTTALEKSSRKVILCEPERVLYEDDSLLCYNKPPGLTSDPHGIGSLFPRYLLVHRLDKDTSGAILLAKSPEVLMAMVDLFRKQEVQKTYLALVDGVPRQEEGVIENFLGKISSENRPLQWGIVPPNKGKYARTSWKVIRSGPQAALVRCTPFTGRTHQIRVHLHSLGHSILGDTQYCRKFRCSYVPQRCLLHASGLHFVHPRRFSPLEIEAPLSEDFLEAMEAVLP